MIQYLKDLLSDLSLIGDGLDGYDDYTAELKIGATSPSNTPVYKDIGNGFYELSFAAGDIGFLKFHIKHDIKVNSKAYQHIHFGPETTMVAGETIIWRLSLVQAERDGLESFNVAPHSVDLTYVADGNEVGACHRVIEAVEAEAIDAPNVDGLVLMRCERIGGTYTGGVYGYTGDLHYRKGRLSTPNRAFPFV